MKINCKEFRVRPGDKGQTQRVADDGEALFQVEEAVSRNSWVNTLRS